MFRQVVVGAVVAGILWAHEACAEPGLLALPAVWRVKLDEQDVGVAEKWFSPDFDDGDWAPVSTHKLQGWEQQGLPEHVGFAWYRTPVTPDDLSDDTWICYARIGNNIYRHEDISVTNCIASPGQGTQLLTLDIILNSTNPAPTGEGCAFADLVNATGVDIILRSRFIPAQNQSLSNPRLDMRMQVYTRSASN